MKQIAIISDFNINLFERYLKLNECEYEFQGLPFGQVFQSLLSEDKFDSSIIWTLPESISPTFKQALQYNEIIEDHVLSEVDAYSEALIKFTDNQDFSFIVSWAFLDNFNGHEMQNWKEGTGIQSILSKMNLRLAENLKDSDNLFILDSQRWVFANDSKISTKLWYSAKIPFSNDVFLRSSEAIHASIKALSGKSKKLIILDLDNTLWGGVVGETGWQGINLGGHDILGEAFVDFQLSLKGLTRRGIQLAIVSKNDEEVALEAIRNHPSMVLKEDDFAGWKINWNDKAENVYQLVDELNLGLESVVFIDDNPAERMRVKDAFPDVLVPDWPKDITSYTNALNNLSCFYNPSISKEDRERTAMYVAERERNNKKSTTSKANWLSELNTEIETNILVEENISRVTQLFNKTNQLNLSTRRLSLSELKDWNSNSGNSIYTFSVSDRFGDLGLVGILGTSVKKEKGYITDFILSCRAMGREVEKSMFYFAVNLFKEKEVNLIEAQYLPTERNRPTLDVLNSLSFKEITENKFIIDCDPSSLKPKYTTIVSSRR